MSKQANRYADKILSDPRWASVVERELKADGQFYYSVKTTGVYCRPSCGSRTPRPENINFYLTTTEAEIDGFRPCKRCKPGQAPLRQQRAELVAKLCRQIETTEKPPSLAALAQSAQLSTSHLYRIFKAVTGITPKAYAVAHRAKRARGELTRTETVTSAIYESGYNTDSRFYDEANRLPGVTPRAYRAGGTNAAIRFAVGECSLGAILVAASERGLCAILIGDDPDALLRDLQDRLSKASLIAGDIEFERVVSEVIRFVEMPKLGIDLPLDIRGTAFQQRVWRALQAIPAGSTVTYAEIAARIGAPNAARAVANACAANALAVAIPCHRVIRDDGELSGYRWGVERKRALLERESKS